MLKIGIVVNKLTRGGAEALVVSHTNTLVASGYDVYLFILRKTNKQETFYSNLNISSGKIYHLDLRSLFNIFKLLRLARVFKEHRFNIVMTHLFESNLIGRLAALLAGIPCIISVEHSVYTHKTLWQKTVDRVLARGTTVIFGVSQQVINFTAKQEHIPMKKFKLLRQMVDTSIKHVFTTDQLRKRFNIPSGSLVVITVGRFSAEKGVLEIPSIASRCLELSFDVKPTFIIVGYGSLEVELRAQVDKLSLSDCVHVVTDPYQVKEYLIIGDIFLLPSEREGVPVAMLEAMTHCLVPVASNVGGVPEVIDDTRDGFLIEKGDTDGFAKVIHYLHCNRHALEKMKNKSQDKARSYICPPEEFISTILQIYNTSSR